MNPREKYFTEEGLSALENRLKSIYAIYLSAQEEDYPIKHQMIGFVNLHLTSKEQCAGHIEELKQLLIADVNEEEE